MTNQLSYTAEQVAEMLQVTRRWVLAHSTGKQSPKIPHIKMGRWVRFLPDAVAKFQESICTTGVVSNKTVSL